MLLYVGDTLEDANFDRAVANQAIAYLFNEEEWILSVLAEAEHMRTGPLLFMDATLTNELNYLIEATLVEFSGMRFRDGLHRCWFDMMIARGNVLIESTIESTCVCNLDYMNRHVP